MVYDTMKTESDLADAESTGDVDDKTAETAKKPFHPQEKPMVITPWADFLWSKPLVNTKELKQN